MGTVKEKTKEYWDNTDEKIAAKISEKRFQLIEAKERARHAEVLFHGRKLKNVPIHWQRAYNEVIGKVKKLKAEILYLQTIPPLDKDK